VQGRKVTRRHEDAKGGGRRRLEIDGSGRIGVLEAGAEGGRIDPRTIVDALRRLLPPTPGIFAPA
jgi:hypothetical protein